jgi:hypothetical protein
MNRKDAGTVSPNQLITEKKTMLKTAMKNVVQLQ